MFKPPKKNRQYMKHRAVLSLVAVLIAAITPLVFEAAAEDISPQTRAEIDFIAGIGPVDPLDPDYPDDDLANLSDVNITNDSDSLSLNTVPDFTFAEADGTAFPARLMGEGYYPLYRPLRPYVQVSDLRGTGGGWKLSVSASQFLKDEKPALNGARIRLLGGSAHSSNPALSPPGVNDRIIIECTGQVSASVTVADALGGDNGMGAWIIRWYPAESRSRVTASGSESGIDLYIPPGTLVLPGKYTATLYWTLTDAV